jgi:rare lipoprotein A
MRKSADRSIMFRVSLNILLILLAVAFLSSCGSMGFGTRSSRGKSLGYKTVSWYGPGFNGKRTASGEIYDMNAMTCAHKKLPFGSRLRIVNPQNGRSVVLTVNDRGPFVRGRDIDLSRGAAVKLDVIKKGTARVKAYYLDRDMRYASYIKDGKVKGREPAGRVISASAYTIQVASFRERDNAVYLKKGLDLVHDKVYLMVKWINGAKFYRVRVGRFGSESKALKYARALAYEGYPDVHVTAFE